MQQQGLGVASVQQQGRDACCSTLAVTNLRNKGLLGWRYDCKCNYLITLVTDPRAGIFGTLKEWGVERSAEGRVVYEAWQRIEVCFPGVRATYNSIMPDHFHGIIYITEDGVADLRVVVAAFAADVERTLGRRIWAELWRDSICLQRGQLHRQINYVLSNAKRRWIKENNPGLFKKVLGFRHWRLEGIEETLADVADVDHWDFRAYKVGLAAEQSELWSVVDGVEIAKPRKANRLQCAFEDGRAGGTASVQQQGKGRIGWTVLGNPFLLEEPLLVSVRISRRTPVAEFEKLQNKLRLKIERGAVLIGAWVSPLEREIRRQAVAAGGRIVELLPRGMGRYYKPGGDDFQLCEQGRLLQLSAFEPQQAGSGREEIGKPRFEWLNRAAEAIGDVAIGYAVR